VRRLLLGLFAVLALAAPAAAQGVYAIGVTQPGSLLYAGGAGVVKVLDEKLKMNARLQPYAGSSTYAPLLGRNEIEFGLINVDDAVTAYKGIDNYEGRPNPSLRLLNVLFPLPFGVLVAADSPIKTMHDLKGVRMPGQYVGMSTGRRLQDAVLASVGLSSADMRIVPVANLFQGVDALAQGRVDAASIGPGTAQVQVAHGALSGRGGVRYLSVDDSPEGVARMRAVMSMRPIVMNPAPHLPGIVGPTKLIAYSMFFVANDKLSDDMAYRVVQALHANKELMVPSHPVLQGFDPARMTETSETPFHPGAIKFYTEIGQWPPKD